MKRYTGIEQIIHPSDPRFYWHYIPGFNGYEICFELKMVRSMKHFREYPFGIYIKPRKRSNFEDPTFELSDNNNERKRVRYSQLVELATHNPHGVSGYPRPTYMSDPSSRNDRRFVQISQPHVLIDNTPRRPKFKIIEEALKDDARKYPIYPMYHVPIESIDGSTYYGREDCPMFITGDVYQGSV